VTNQCVFARFQFAGNARTKNKNNNLIGITSQIPWHHTSEKDVSHKPQRKFHCF
jgi:hypothetical protein